MMNMSLLSKSNPVFEGFAFYAAILIVKMILMSPLTGIQRFRKKISRLRFGLSAFANPEDAVTYGVDVKRDDEDVERVRRAHLNDLENIPVFLLTGVLFVLTDPDLIFALMLFRLYTLARIIHTIVYAIYVIRQPTRAIAFFVGIIINIIMIICIFISFHQV